MYYFAGVNKLDGLLEFTNIRTNLSETDFFSHLKELGARGCVVVKALCYKPEGRALDTR
jgi:hypothetical protein